MPRHIHPQPFVIHPQIEADLPTLLRLGSQLSGLYADRKLVDEQHLKAVGGALWQALGVDSDFAAARQAAVADILPIIIESDSAAVQALPWETIHHPELGFLGLHQAFTLARRTGPARAASAPADKGPLRVLLFTSLPDDLDPKHSRLNVEEEQASVQESLALWVAGGTVRLEMPDDGRFATFQTLLKDFAPHLVFLSGHGRFHHEPHSGEPPYGEFLFEGEHGQSSSVRETELAGAFVGSGVQAVVLSACESGKAASDALNNGLTRALAALGIPHVVGMRESILDRAGIQFTRALCDELGCQGRLDYALQAARAAIQKPLAGISRRESDFSALAELSLGQWCLPMLLTSDPARPLVDWDFAPAKVDALQITNTSLDTVSLPARFIGRRAELRDTKNRLLKGELRQLLVTGAGGQGKTSLAGKLALDLRARGWRVLAWSARAQNSWGDFEFDIQLALNKDNAETYTRLYPQVQADESKRAALLLRLLAGQLDGKLLLFFDNLESLQDPDSLQLTDPQVAAWIQAALRQPRLCLLATSRWQIPAWPGEELPLRRASYGDFLQMAQMQGLPGLLPDRDSLRRIYDVLGGNGRGLDFFTAALKSAEERLDKAALLDKLATTRQELQVNLAIAEIHAHLPEEARALLARLPVYPQPAPLEGILKLGEGLQAEAAIARLAAVSLVEVHPNPAYDCREYVCAPLAADWLETNSRLDRDPRWLALAAEYQVYLHSYERRSLPQALIAHAALLRAGQKDQADRLALDQIFGPLTRAGLYATLLNKWAPAICESKDLQTRAEGLGQTGKLLLHIGQYETALLYLKQSLLIMQQIGDKQGEGIALNNVSQVFQAQGDYQTALNYLKQSLLITQQIGDKQGEGTALNNISKIFKAQGDYQTALEYLKQSLLITQQIGDKQSEGTTLNNISQVFQAQGDYQTALNYLKQSLLIKQQIGDKQGEAATLGNIGTSYHAQSDYQTALDYLKQSLVIMQQIGDKQGEGTALNNISNIFQAQGDYQTTLDYLKQSLLIMQQIGDKQGEAATLGNIGTSYHAQSDYQTALNYLKQSLLIRQQIGDKQGEGNILNNISQIFQAQADYQTALNYLKQSLLIRQQIGDKQGEGTTLNNISQIFQAQGDYQTALDYLKQSLLIMQQIGDKQGEGTTLNNISQIYDAQGDYQAALDYLKQSLLIRQQIGDKQGEGIALNNISQIYNAQGDYQTALDYLKQSLLILQQIGDKAGLCVTLFNMGHIYAQNEQIQEAAGAWVTSYQIAKTIGYAQILQALANLAPKLGLPLGLDGWEMLAKRMQNDEGGIQNEGPTAPAQDELGQVRQLVGMVVGAVREKSPEAGKLFENVSKLSGDPQAPPHYRALGKVLRAYMSGIRQPDLSELPEKFAKVVREAIGE
ncbi:MAG: tetratricopeptide repeat protein [Anaerolineae bacterium]|nr:tetratricopeptide repeat protein [Anaerolineae bacterium]